MESGLVPEHAPDQIRPATDRGQRLPWSRFVEFDAKDLFSRQAVRNGLKIRVHGKDAANRPVEDRTRSR